MTGCPQKNPTISLQYQNQVAAVMRCSGDSNFRFSADVRQFIQDGVTSPMNLCVGKHDMPFTSLHYI